MRVVAGEFRGRRIVAPAGTSTRPTTDKVREATFNALGSRDLVVGAQVADLYAGSGAIGIEARREGADHCTSSSVIAMRAGTSHQPRRAGLTPVTNPDRRRAPGRGRGRRRLVFADPPYDFAAWDRLPIRYGRIRRAESGAELHAPRVRQVVSRMVSPSPGRSDTAAPG